MKRLIYLHEDRWLHNETAAVEFQTFLTEVQFPTPELLKAHKEEL